MIGAVNLFHVVFVFMNVFGSFCYVCMCSYVYVYMCLSL